MPSSLKVAVASLDIAWADVEENLSTTEKCLNRLSVDTDLLVLPELFSTGYIIDQNTLSDVAESNSGKTVGRLTELARRHSVAIAGSFLAREGTRFYNRAFFIEPSGETVFYDKNHLFSLSSEMNIFEAGTHPYPVVRFRGWNIAMIICYDLRFPAWCRNRPEAYDLMLVPANWPQSRKYAWEHLLIARAIENQAVFVGANRSGEDDFGCYKDMSLVFDAMGKPINPEEDSVVNLSGTNLFTVKLDKHQLEECRSKLPFLNDANEFGFV